MRDITKDELEVWKLYAEPEYVGKPMPVYHAKFMYAGIQPYGRDFISYTLGEVRAPIPSMPAKELDISMEIQWDSNGMGMGVDAFSLENRRRALAILLDIPDDHLTAEDMRGVPG
jgi:hypothetical protein